MKFIFMSMAFALTICLACEQEEVMTDEATCEAVIVNQDRYDAIASTDFSITSATIEEDCLVLEFSASGCDGNSWVFELVDSEAIAESLPVQRFLKVAFKNPESCLAVFQQTRSYDLQPLQVGGNSAVIFNLVGWEQPLLYEY